MKEMTEKTKLVKFSPGETVTLPIGLDWKGQRYRQVHIDELRGLDDRRVASKKTRNNAGRALTVMLQRAVMEIDGLYTKPGATLKERRQELVPLEMVRAMYGPDREFLFFAIQALGLLDEEDNAVIPTRVVCPACESVNDIRVDLFDLDVLCWEDPGPPQFDLILPKGFEMTDGAFPTNQRCTFQVYTGKEQEDLADCHREDIPSAVLAAGIVKVDGMTGRPTLPMVDYLRTRDRLAALRQVEEYTPGLDLRMDLKCYGGPNGECEHSWVSVLDAADFFSNGETGKKTPRPK